MLPFSAILFADADTSKKSLTFEIYSTSHSFIDYKHPLRDTREGCGIWKEYWTWN